MVEATRLDRYRAGIPVYRYVVDPAVPPVSVIRFTQEALGRLPGHSHMHDFPALVYFERDGGSLKTGHRQWPIQAGDLYVISPGVVVTPETAAGLWHAGGTAIFFIPEALAAHRSEPLPSWRAHPLLSPFVQGAASGALRLRVPVADRRTWTQGIAAIEAELAERRDGYRQAALAHLTLLLVSVARLATDVVGDLRLNNEKLLAEVFGVIEQRYRERLSLRDVARAVNLTAGHLTTVVRRKTGRTVLDWITERRMTEARRLLIETELTVNEISRAVGFADPSYFARSFRRAHGVGPREWRGRAAADNR
jgi:AraC family transcriptional activator of pobA